MTQVTVVLLQKQLQPFFFFASICSEWLASVYVSEQLHSDCIMFVAWKAWFPCCQGHVTVKPYSAQSLKKEKRSIGHCCFLYVLLLLNDFTCEIELLQFMLLVISQFTWAFAFLGVMRLLSWSFALLDIILLVLKIFNVQYCNWNFATTAF